eukprot:UN29767
MGPVPVWGKETKIKDQEIRDRVGSMAYKRINKVVVDRENAKTTRLPQNNFSLKAFFGNSFEG